MFGLLKQNWMYVEFNILEFSYPLCRFSSFAKAGVGLERGCYVGMGLRHPRYLGSSLFRLSMVRLYYYCNTVFAHNQCLRIASTLLAH